MSEPAKNGATRTVPRRSPSSRYSRESCGIGLSVAGNPVHGRRRVRGRPRRARQFADVHTKLGSPRCAVMAGSRERGGEVRLGKAITTGSRDWFGHLTGAARADIVDAVGPILAQEQP
jgi:hypothetical protein